MATKVGEAYYELTAKNAKLKAKLRESDQATASWTKKMSGMVGKFGKVAFAGAVAGVTAITAVMVKATQAAAAEELQTAQLAHQIGRLGLNAERAMKEVNKLADSQQSLTRFGDTDTRRMLAGLIMLTDDYEGSMKNLSLAQDMAESGMFDARSAVRMLGMAMVGNVEILGRYIPELKTSNTAALKTMTTSQKAAFAVELLQKKFGGLAKQIGTTTAGAWAKLKNAASDAMEAMGVGMLDETSSGLLDITQVIKDMEPELRKIGEAAGVFAENILHAAKWWTELFAGTEEAQKRRIKDTKILIEQFERFAERVRDLIREQIISKEVGEAMLDAWDAPLSALRAGQLSYEQALGQLLDLETNFEQHRERIQQDFQNRRMIQAEKAEAEERKRKKKALDVWDKELRDTRMKRLGMENQVELNAIDERFKKILEKVKGFADLEKLVEEERFEAIIGLHEKNIKETEKILDEFRKKEEAERKKQMEKERSDRVKALQEELSQKEALQDALLAAEQTFLRDTGQEWVANRIEFERRYDEMLKIAEGNAEARSLIEAARAAELRKIIEQEKEEMKTDAEEMNRIFHPELVGVRELGRRAMVGRSRPELRTKAEPSDEDKRHTSQFDEMIELQKKQVDNTKQNIAVLGP